MWYISKEIQLDSAHKLEGHPKCGNIHGHTYMVEIDIKGDKLNAEGMLVDFGVIKEKLSKYDHCLLNDRIKKPTAERLALVFWEEIQEYCSSLTHLPFCCRVRVWETPTSYAEYLPEG